MKIYHKASGALIFEGEIENLKGANLSGADLRGTDLSGADLSGANLSGANLSGTDLSGTDLRGTDLRGTNLFSANLRGTDLSGADLSGANLRGANLRGANLRGTDLFGVKWDGSVSEEQCLVNLKAVAKLALATPGNDLEMSTWHTCETTHCIAGWAHFLFDGSDANIDPFDSGIKHLGINAASHFMDFKGGKDWLNQFLD